MNRTELIEAGARNTTVSADDVARIIEDVESLIRADLHATVLRLAGPAGLLPTEDVLAVIDKSST